MKITEPTRVGKTRKRGALLEAKRIPCRRAAGGPVLGMPTSVCRTQGRHFLMRTNG